MPVPQEAPKLYEGVAKCDEIYDNGGTWLFGFSFGHFSCLVGKYILLSHYWEKERRGITKEEKEEEKGKKEKKGKEERNGKRRWKRRKNEKREKEEKKKKREKKRKNERKKGKRGKKKKKKKEKD
jgi:hypothetical protein